MIKSLLIVEKFKGGISMNLKKTISALLAASILSGFAIALPVSAEAELINITFDE